MPYPPQSLLEGDTHYKHYSTTTAPPKRTRTAATALHTEEDVAAKRKTHQKRGVLQGFSELSRSEHQTLGGQLLLREARQGLCSATNHPLSRSYSQTWCVEPGSPPRPAQPSKLHGYTAWPSWVFNEGQEVRDSMGAEGMWSGAPPSIIS